MKQIIDACMCVCLGGFKAKKWHPDRKLDDQEIATNRFKEVRSLPQDEPFFLLTDIIVWA